MGDDNPIVDGAGFWGKSCSNSDGVKRDDFSSLVDDRSDWFLSGRRLTWGKHPEESNKIIPIDKIFCMI